MTDMQPRKASATERTIRFLNYLKKNTDKDHTMKLKDIKAAFNEMDLKPGCSNTIHKFIMEMASALNTDCEEHALPKEEWRLIFDDYTKLYGTETADIQETNDGETDERDDVHIKNLYYNHELSYEEIDAVVEAVRFYEMLSDKEAKKIIRTLEEQFTSKYYKDVRNIHKIYEEKNYDRKRLKENLLIIQQAIEEDVQIEYLFNGYTHEKKLAPQGDYKRIVSPYYVVVNNKTYYLLAANEQYKNTLVLRIDLMTEVSIPRDGKTNKGIKRIPKKDVDKLPEKLDQSYLSEHINMSYDDPVDIELRVKNPKLPDNPEKCKTPEYTFLYDTFGDQFEYKGVDKDDIDYDIIKVKCSPFGMTNFAVQYAEKVEVRKPPEVRDMVKNKVMELQRKYL